MNPHCSALKDFKIVCVVNMVLFASRQAQTQRYKSIAISLVIL